MSIQINKVILQGRLSNDPKIETTAGGTTVATTNIATSKYRKDKQTGQRVEHSTFTRIVAYGKLAELIQNYAGKGKEVYVEGEIETRSWDGQNGKQYITEVVVNELQLGADPKGQSRDNNQAQSQPAHQQQGGYQQQQAPRQPQRQAPQKQRGDFDPGF